jgi:hypothetical protein
LEVVEAKKILPKYQQNKGVGIMSKTQYFAFLEFVLTFERIAMYTVL